MSNAPTCKEIAASWELWQEHIDPDGNMTEAEFDEMTSEETLAMIHECFPTDCNCE